MRTIYLFLLAMIFIVGCTNQEQTMDLLDENIREINVSKSNGVGDMNQDILVSISDKESIKIFENIIRTAVKQKSNNDAVKPDFDLMVEYEGDLPTHAIHLMLGEKGEESILMYIDSEGETYVTSSNSTDQLRELILSE
ncbi:hypothetical protein GGQ92_003030 [Gracilibacillus halotolerans]|uniref:YhfM-like domain-containing protein n=1 Tax=Gracilibacillus halotolerans TaxID=74386 RepID=A0A841RUR6_9BACI|nr:hypothetical protein [Gracilibacillus halotolerans]MBB6514208.1 hypothetical protein [Gracilibacillus halotolerans]